MQLYRVLDARWKIYLFWVIFGSNSGGDETYLVPPGQNLGGTRPPRPPRDLRPWVCSLAVYNPSKTQGPSTLDTCSNSMLHATYRIIHVACYIIARTWIRVPSDMSSIYYVLARGRSRRDAIWYLGWPFQVRSQLRFRIRFSSRLRNGISHELSNVGGSFRSIWWMEDEGSCVNNNVAQRFIVARFVAGLCTAN